MPLRMSVPALPPILCIEMLDRNNFLSLNSGFFCRDHSTVNLVAKIQLTKGGHPIDIGKAAEGSYNDDELLPARYLQAG